MHSQKNKEMQISNAFVETIKNNYLTPVNLKKIDIGGDMIHGNASDFRCDTSDKIILSHTSQSLDNDQKAIGSGAPYGTVDVLIPRYQNYVRRTAHSLLHSYFPSVHQKLLHILLNNEMVTFNPESILIREGIPNTSIYLILTGSVEIIRRDFKERGSFVVSSGALVGEQPGLHGLPALETYRARSFVQALDLPCKQYLEFVNRNDLYETIETLNENREFLRHTWLFGEALSQTTLNKLAASMKITHYPRDSQITVKGRYLRMVKSGILRWITKGDSEPILLSEGDFFGARHAIMGQSKPDIYKVVETAANVYSIPAEAFAHLPIVRWKLLEAWSKIL